MSVIYFKTLKHAHKVVDYVALARPNIELRVNKTGRSDYPFKIIGKVSQGLLNDLARIAGFQTSKQGVLPLKRNRKNQRRPGPEKIKKVFPRVIIKEARRAKPPPVIIVKNPKFKEGDHVRYSRSFLTRHKIYTGDLPEMCGTVISVRAKGSAPETVRVQWHGNISGKSVSSTFASNITKGGHPQCKIKNPRRGYPTLNQIQKRFDAYRKMGHTISTARRETEKETGLSLTVTSKGVIVRVQGATKNPLCRAPAKKNAREFFVGAFENENGVSFKITRQGRGLKSPVHLWAKNSPSADSPREIIDRPAARPYLFVKKFSGTKAAKSYGGKLTRRDLVGLKPRRENQAPPAKRKNPSPVKVDQAIKLYEEFHGNPGSDVYDLKLPGHLKDVKLPPLSFLGRLSQLNYATKKNPDGNELTEYEHRFKKGSVVLGHPASKKNPSMIVLLGPFKIKPEGITG